MFIAGWDRMVGSKSEDIGNVIDEKIKWGCERLTPRSLLLLNVATRFASMMEASPNA
jgi:hypothetical protein